MLSNAGIKVNVKIAPKTPRGTDSKIENGTDQLSYSAANNKNTNKIQRPKIIIVIFPDFVSCKANPEKSYEYPFGNVSAATS
ncbi:hypothetical protein D3C72_1908510 [compost metagenome]